VKKTKKIFAVSKNVSTFAIPLEKIAGIFTPLAKTPDV
jgi:hypothetical protein